MSLYITAQLIGFLGFLLLASAPYFKNKRNFIKTEIAASSLLSLQWLLLEQPGMTVINIIDIALSLSILKAKNCALTKKLIPLFYPVSLGLLLIISKGTMVDLLGIIGFFSIIKAKSSEDMLVFRSYAILAVMAFTASGFLAQSIPAVLFGTVRIVIHTYRLHEFWQQSNPQLSYVKLEIHDFAQPQKTLQQSQ